MSAGVNHDYAPTSKAGERTWAPSWPAKRLVAAAIGCAVMALCGGGLANYLDTSWATGSDVTVSGQADAATLN